MIHRGTYDGTIYHNPVNKFCIISVKTADKEVPQEARSTRRYRDHLIRFVATGYELPRTDAVELELDGEWTKGKYGVQLQVEQWREIVPKTKDGVEGYLASGLIKGIGPATAAQIVSRFGVETLDILQNHPERLLEVKGITESKLEDIKTSYAESRMLQDLMTLLSPFKITPKTALKIYQHFGPASVDILKKSPFELCQVSGFGFLRVDAIVQKNGGDLHDPMRVKGALFWALEDSKGGKGHLFLPGETLRKEALRLLNAKIPLPSLRLHEQEVADVLQDMILHGEVVSVKDNIYLPRTFAQEDETARRIAMRLIEPSAPERIEQALEQVKREMGLVLSSKQEAAVYAAYRHSLSIITGSPGTGKTTVLKTILEVYRRLHPKGEIVLMAPTGRASRRMAESTGFDKARTLHSGLGLGSEEDDANRSRQQEPLSADLIIVDEFSMVDMWLADKFFSRIKDGARVVLVGDPDQLPSVGAGTVFRELIDCGLIPVTVLDQIFRQSKDSLIAYNAKFINEGNTKLYFGPDFVFMASDNQAEAAERIIARYCREIAESGIDRVQILSPFRSEGAASAEQLNEAIREVVNPFRSAEEEIKIGVKVFRVNDRIMQTKNTAKVSNGDLGFIRYIKDDEDGKRVGLDFGVGRELEYSVEDMVNLDLSRLKSLFNHSTVALTGGRLVHLESCQSCRSFGEFPAQGGLSRRYCVVKYLLLFVLLLKNTWFVLAVIEVMQEIGLNSHAMRQRHFGSGKAIGNAFQSLDEMRQLGVKKAAAAYRFVKIQRLHLLSMKSPPAAYELRRLLIQAPMGHGFFLDQSKQSCCIAFSQARARPSSSCGTASIYWAVMPKASSVSCTSPV